ncbi:MAG: sialidase family protein [Polyangia bacterium]
MKRAALALLLSLASHTPTSVYAHGSLPIAQQIYWQGDTMMVPAAYWGLFIGTEGGPWRWICEEAINLNQQRKWAILSDGTLFATDRTGVSVSRDAGCSWGTVSAPVNTLDAVAITADPTKPRVWVLANDSAAGKDSGLWFSDDQGRTWQQSHALATELPAGLAISADGRTVLVSAMTQDMPRKAVLYTSKDGGASFVPRMLSEPVDGKPFYSFAPVFIDPRATDRVFLRVPMDAGDVLLRSEAGGPFTEAMRTPGKIQEVQLDAASDQLFVATTKGLFAAKATAALAPLPSLSSAQCVSPHNGTLYACAWNYAPDQAAIARLSSDASSFTKVFQFHDTKEPLACPPETPVSKICPGIWRQYADQLGIDLDQRSSPTETPMNSGGCQAATGTTARGPISPLILFLAALPALWLRRRREHPRALPRPAR